MENKPLLSICIPTYNRANIVYECVRECLKLPYDWIEVVVTNNCSSDNTAQILSGINDPRFKLFHNESNIGYENLTKCLTNGSGKFCLLLGDEDSFLNTDWDSVKKQLENDKNTAVFQFTYFDTKGKQLFGTIEQFILQNTFEAFKKAYNNFAFSAGMVIRKEILDICWKEAIRKPLLWSLYNERIIPIYSVKYGDYAILNNISSHRTKRDGSGYLDSSAWCGTMAEPYWSMQSRKKQFEEWIEFFSEFDVDYKMKVKLAEVIIHDAILFLSGYYGILYARNTDSPLFKKYKELILRDRKELRFKWIRSSYEMYAEIREKFAQHFESYNKLEYNKVVILAFMRMYLSFAKKIVRSALVFLHVMR